MTNYPNPNMPCYGYTQCYPYGYNMAEPYYPYYQTPYYPIKYYIKPDYYIQPVFYPGDLPIPMPQPEPKLNQPKDAAQLGCICPAGANLYCENPTCPRKAPK